jgi:glucosylceramidase
MENLIMKPISFLALSIFFMSIMSQLTMAQTSSIPLSAKGKKASIYTTAEGTNFKLSLTDTLSFEKVIQPTEGEVFVFVNPLKTFQTVMGIGGALTDASAEVFAKLSEKQQDEFMNALYSKDKGIGYTIGRTNIASCDFGSETYNYIKDGDKTLKTFNISHDRLYRIPMIKKAIEYAGGKLPLLASPWSPPAFMKSNNNVLRGGKLLPEFAQAWANYYVKFIKAYKKEGIPIFAISIQNEPMAIQKWESCVYTAEEERDFLKNFVGPTIKKSEVRDTKIVVWDHNRDLLSQRASVLFEDPEASKYAWGIGIHWYETWSGSKEMFNNVRNVHESYPDKNILFTEGCIEKFDFSKLNSWTNAERYGYNMINDFNNGIMGYIDWNILLDEKGGPNHVGNFCFAPIHFNTQTKELVYTPIFYYIGHFSKFIRPNAKRVSTTSSRSSLLTTSFINENGKMTTIVMNKTDEEIKYKLLVGSYMTSVVIEPHAMQSIVY